MVCIEHNMSFNKCMNTNLDQIRVQIEGKKTKPTENNQHGEMVTNKTINSLPDPPLKSSAASTNPGPSVLDNQP